jgi:hypothetical protein
MAVLPSDTNSTATPLPTMVSSSGLSTGAKAGIGIGVTAGVMLIVPLMVTCVFIIRKHKKHGSKLVLPKPQEICPELHKPGLGPYHIPILSNYQHQELTEPVSSYGSDKTAVEPSFPTQQTSLKPPDAKRILGIDNRTFLDGLPRLEGTRSMEPEGTQNNTDKYG